MEIEKALGEATSRPAPESQKKSYEFLLPLAGTTQYAHCLSLIRNGTLK